MIQDWVGALWVPGATLPKILAVLQDYDSHTSVYHPEGAESKLVSRDGDRFEIYRRLVKTE